MGIGTALVRSLEAHALDLGFRRLYLYTESAEQFYRRLGWETIDRDQWEGEEIAIMTTEVRPRAELRLCWDDGTSSRRARSWQDRASLPRLRLGADPGRGSGGTPHGEDCSVDPRGTSYGQEGAPSSTVDPAQ